MTISSSCLQVYYCTVLYLSYHQYHNRIAVVRILILPCIELRPQHRLSWAKRNCFQGSAEQKATAGTQLLAGSEPAVRSAGADRPQTRGENPSGGSGCQVLLSRRGYIDRCCMVDRLNPVEDDDKDTLLSTTKTGSIPSIPRRENHRAYLCRFVNLPFQCRGPKFGWCTPSRRLEDDHDDHALDADSQSSQPPISYRTLTRRGVKMIMP